MKDNFSAVSRVPVPDIKTKAELKAREKQRAKPEVVRHLTPGGSVAKTVNARVQANNEERIATLRSRLGQSQQQMRSQLRAVKDKGAMRAGFAKAGPAKTAHERSR